MIQVQECGVERLHVLGVRLLSVVSSYQSISCYVDTSYLDMFASERCQLNHSTCHTTRKFNSIYYLRYGFMVHD